VRAGHPGVVSGQGIDNERVAFLHGVMARLLSFRTVVAFAGFDNTNESLFMI